MKKRTIVFLIATVLTCWLIGLRAQSDKPQQPVNDAYPNFEVVTSIPPRKTQISLIDSPQPPKYQYFYKATVGINEWQRSADTMNYVLNLLGETLTVPQAREYKTLFYRNFSKLQFSLDSIRLPEPQKPKK